MGSLRLSLIVADLSHFLVSCRMIVIEVLPCCTAFYRLRFVQLRGLAAL